MAISGFVVKWDEINQAIVSLSTYQRKNPHWNITVFYDDILTKMKLESIFSDLTFVELDDADPVCALSYALNDTTETALALFDTTTVCNRPMADLSTVDLRDRAILIRPDRPFELTNFGWDYKSYDPRYLDRYTRSRSYFSLGVVVFHLTVLRQSMDVVNLYPNYLRTDCLDRKMPAHYLNRVFDTQKKGLLPGHIDVKPEVSLYQVFSPGQCLRHQVRMKRATIANFSDVYVPWMPLGKLNKLFLQVPYRDYCNYALLMSAHLETWFIENVRYNAKLALDRFGNLDKAFDEVYDVATV